MTKHLNRASRGVLLGAALIAASGLTSSFAAPNGLSSKGGDDNDQEVLIFSTVGDSRQDPVSPDPTTLPLSGQDAHWLQNTRALSRILNSVEDLRSDFLFFNGDMIMGYGKASVPALPASPAVGDVVNSDLVQFYTQYAFWRGLVARSLENGTYIVPVPGNHETQWKKGGKKAQVENENAWRANMGDLILDDNRLLSLLGESATHEDIGNTAAPDGLATDQSKLSYSFDFHGSHFAVINTDPVGRDAHAPTQWLAGDLAAARARGIKTLFVFGHKPAFTYYYGAVTPLPASPSGLDNDPASRDAFWKVIEDNGATYFCGHEHIFNLSQHGKAWQILVGSGGSPFEAAPTDATINPATDRTYAWATVKVYKSGKVKISAYGFNDSFGPTQELQTITLGK